MPYNSPTVVDRYITGTTGHKLVSTGISSQRDRLFLVAPIMPRKVKKNKKISKDVFVKVGERPFRLRAAFRAQLVSSLIVPATQTQYQKHVEDRTDEISLNYFNSRKQEFLYLLTATDFYNGETDELERLTDDFIKKNKPVFLNWIQQLFLDFIEKANVEVGILNLMRLYTYDELKPASQMIALSAREMSDNRVKNAAFSLFGHWGDERALKLLEAYDRPSDPLMAIKYDALIKDIRQYAVRQRNR